MKHKKKKRKRAKHSKGPDFSYHRDVAAIIDRIGLSVRGTLNDTFRDQELSEVHNIPIFHPGGFYAACSFAVWRLTGNPLSIHYGKMTKFKNVPHLRFTLRSEHIPLTEAQGRLLVRRCVCGPKEPEVTVSSVELTFDVTAVNIEEVHRQLIHRATRVTILEDDRGRRTIYVGAPTSSWQARIYRKTEGVVRLEFVLRRGFLSRCGINKPQDVLLLRRVKLWRLLSVRRFSRSHAQQVTKCWKNPKTRQSVVDWFKEKRPKESLLRVLRWNNVKANSVFRKTDLQRRLEAMQRRLIW